MVTRNVKLYEYKGKFTYGLEIEDVPNDIAEKLVKELNLDVRYARYHVDGSWYSQMYDFPCVLFDRFGYIIFKTEKEYLSHGIENNEKHIQIDQGIHLIQGYTLYPYVPKVLTEIKLDMMNAEKRRIYIKEQEEKRLKHISNLKLIMQNTIKKAGTSSIIPV